MLALVLSKSSFVNYKLKVQFCHKQITLPQYYDNCHLKINVERFESTVQRI